MLNIPVLGSYQNMSNGPYYHASYESSPPSYRHLQLLTKQRVPAENLNPLMLDRVFTLVKFRVRPLIHSAIGCNHRKVINYLLFKVIIEGQFICGLCCKCLSFSYHLFMIKTTFICMQGHLVYNTSCDRKLVDVAIIHFRYSSFKKCGNL